MREYIISAADEGQTLLKYLGKVLPGAGSGVFFKALRKKNIVINGAKVTGKEILKRGDSVKVFFSDDVINKFSPKYGGSAPKVSVKKEELKKFAKNIVYEDENILIINKDAGILTQPDASGETSLNDILLSYLEEGTKHFAVKPSVCNRLDRNTSGIVLCGRTQKGLKGLSAILKDRSLKKYYNAVVFGSVKEKLKFGGFLYKDEKENKSVISDKKPDEAYDEVLSEGEPVSAINVKGTCLTLMKLRLITGKPHQLRAQLLHAGYPVIGDIKYCTEESLKASKELKIGRQLLHAYRLEFPDIRGELSYLSGKSFEAEMKEDMRGILKYRK